MLDAKALPTPVGHGDQTVDVPMQLVIQGTVALGGRTFRTSRKADFENFRESVYERSEKWSHEN